MRRRKNVSSTRLENMECTLKVVDDVIGMQVFDDLVRDHYIKVRLSRKPLEVHTVSDTPFKIR